MLSKPGAVVPKSRSPALSAAQVAGAKMPVRRRAGVSAVTESLPSKGGAVWVPDWSAGVLYQLDPGTGHVRHKIRLGSALPHFASPSLSGRLALIGTMRGVVAVHGA